MSADVNGKPPDAFHKPRVGSSNLPTATKIKRCKRRFQKVLSGCRQTPFPPLYRSNLKGGGTPIGPGSHTGPRWRARLVSGCTRVSPAGEQLRGKRVAEVLQVPVPNPGVLEDRLPGAAPEVARADPFGHPRVPVVSPPAGPNRNARGPDRGAPAKAPRQPDLARLAAFRVFRLATSPRRKVFVDQEMTRGVVLIPAPGRSRASAGRVPRWRECPNRAGAPRTRSSADRRRAPHRVVRQSLRAFRSAHVPVAP